MPTRTQAWEEFTDETRPQDPGLDGEGWTYENLEHGGECSDYSLPQAILAKDAEGRSATYEITTVGGRAVKSHGYRYDKDTHEL